MKKIIAIAAIAILGGSVTATWAHDQQLGGNEDLYGSMLMDHKPGSQGHEGQKGEGDLYGSHVANPEDISPTPGAKPEPIDPSNALHDQNPEGYDFNAVN